MDISTNQLAEVTLAHSELEVQMLALRRHTVYGFFTAEKCLFYAGQTKDFAIRLQRHYRESFTTKSVISDLL
jgi:predicted GIY-YIG superfamily endonuclease